MEEGMLPGEELIKQGAEALAYKSSLFDGSMAMSPSMGITCLRKHRPRKPYRHPTLDAKLTTHRILMEARLLQRLRRANVPVPAILFLDVSRGDLFMEFIPGVSVRDYLLSTAVHQDSTPQSLHHVQELPDEAEEGGKGEGMERVMRDIGVAVARMHRADVCHGDLTTSNLLLTHTTINKNGNDGKESDEDGLSVVVIDFGLGSVSNAIEDQAVDLYVLERAFLSTHPSSTTQFRQILDAYRSVDEKRGKAVLARLDAVRLRGRKRTMVG